MVPMPDEQTQDFSGLVEQKESVKLIKNSRGYGWEIRLMPMENEDMDKFMKRLSSVNDYMTTNFGVME